MKIKIEKFKENQGDYIENILEARGVDLKKIISTYITGKDLKHIHFENSKERIESIEKFEMLPMVDIHFDKRVGFSIRWRCVRIARNNSIFLNCELLFSL